jgi:hypothetical protein
MTADPVGYTDGSMFRRFVLAVLLTAAASCSSPPTKEHDQAEAALAAARAADAASYAADDLQGAQAALDKYDQAVGQHDYRQALSDAIDARDRAYEAARQATALKATARQQLQAAVTSLDGLLKAATARLTSPAPPRLTPVAADRLRTASRTATTALQEARTRLDSGHYREGLAAIQPAIEDLQKAATSAEPGRRGRSTH